MKKNYSLMVILLFIILSGCGHGDFNVNFSNEQQIAWVTIENIHDDSFTTNCNSIYLSGKAFISPNWSRCCSSNAEDTGVAVKWENQTTGISGTAIQKVEICYFLGAPYLCNHTYSCDIPLNIGNNHIKIVAIDKSGLKGEKTIFVNKPVYSYSISGKITNTVEKGLWNYGQDGFKLELIGTETFSAYTDKNGEYKFSCIPEGTYKIIPSSPLDFVFIPTERTITLYQDLSNQNFSSDAHFVQGFVKNQLNGIAGVKVTLEDSKNKITSYTDSYGSYYFTVPKGSYLITPSYCYLDQCYTFEPHSISITINDNDEIDLNFNLIN
ncbi:MAG: hypothetical protein OHK0040_10540 [bacterium]